MIHDQFFFIVFPTKLFLDQFAILLPIYVKIYSALFWDKIYVVECTRPVRSIDNGFLSIGDESKAAKHTTTDDQRSSNIY